MVTGTGAAPQGAAGVPWRRLVLPRNRSVWVKWGYLPLGAVAALAVGGRAPSARTLLEVLAVWVVAEHLGYQARYLANDLRDRAADEAHPARAQRRRLPGGLTRTHVGLLWASVAARLVLALAVALLLDGAAGEAALGFLAGLLVITLAYELGRDRVRRATVAPGGAGALGLALPVLTAVPLGYGLRVGAGYHSAAADGLDAVGVLLVGTVLLLQTACVLLAWTLEGTAFLGSFPAADRYDAALQRLAHIGVLLVHAGALDRGAVPVPADDLAPDGGPVRAVVARDRPARSGSQVRAWDVAASAALATSVLTVAVAADSSALRGLLAAGGLLLAAAPWLGRSLVARGHGPDGTWLGSGALAATVRVEALAVLVVGLSVVVLEPRSSWLVLLPVVTALQWASVRASSWVVGVGPGTAVRALAGARTGR
jgi:hypothetical protein